MRHKADIDEDIEKFNYQLPDHRIARHPLSQRDHARLLVWQLGRISHTAFGNLPMYIPPDAMLVLNNSKVIPARIHFRKTSGAVIELFLLDPLFPSTETATVMHARRTSTWKCMIGNKKRWKPGDILQTKVGAQASDPVVLAAKKQGDEDIVTFTWSGDYVFGEVLQHVGSTPLPPYLKRDATPQDRERYQTVYSMIDGAVAAPTAGLHFTPEVLKALEYHGTKLEYVTLHVGAGTFKPVQEKDYRMHDMHTERLVVTKTSIEALYEHDGPLISVGTTSLRILESLYWMGVKIEKHLDEPLHIESDLPYKMKGKKLPLKKKALAIVLQFMENHHLDSLYGSTGIYIFPGYTFKTCRGLLTNFHLPKSTLLLLVSAFTNNDWKKIYQEALDNNYRFLSYGDASLLYRS